VTVHDSRSHRIIDGRGAEFDGDDDYITVSGLIQYASDARFSISFWMTKEACTGNTYEYMYSHQEDSRADAMLRENSNVNIYLACESADSGWSTSGGSVVRFLLRDDSNSGRFARFDYPLHEAGNFDDITNRWVHIVLGVNPGQIKTFVDGQTVTDSDDIHYYADDVGAIDNIAYPDPRALTSPLTGFSLEDDLYLGSRSDGAADRHFVGRLAGVVVGSDQFAAAEAACLFHEGEEFLPAGYSNCPDVPIWNAELALSLLDGRDPPLDASGHRHAVHTHGRVSMSTSGASFDGDGSYLTVDTFEYASDTVFSISLWVHKPQCGGATYEYLYSHYETAQPNWDQSSYALIMFLCEETGARDSTLEGSVLRYDVQDTRGNRGVFDYSVHAAGDFDAITQDWIHVIWTVSTASMATFIDGAAVDPGVPGRYGFYQGLAREANVANPRPDQLTPNLAGLNLLSDIYLGGRFDEHSERAFTGRVALVSVYDRVIGADEAACIFRDGDGLIPAPPVDSRT
jgi:hypothetical protein